MGPTKGPDPIEEWLNRGWDIWKTPTTGRDSTWSAKPVGALVAVMTGIRDLADLATAIDQYRAEADRHVAEARRKLDALPADYTGERGVQTALIEALGAMAH